MIIHLLDYNIKDDKYSNTIISAIAIIGIKEEGGWYSLLNYTLKMSAIIKVA